MVTYHSRNLGWILGHRGIEYNEKIEETARDGSGRELTDVNLRINRWNHQLILEDLYLHYQASMARHGKQTELWSALNTSRTLTMLKLNFYQQFGIDSKYRRKNSVEAIEMGHFWNYQPTMSKSGQENQIDLMNECELGLEF